MTRGWSTDALQELDLANAVVADAKDAHLATGVQCVKGPSHLFWLDQWIWAMEQQDVDVFGLEAPQAALDRAHDVLVAEIKAMRVACARIAREANTALGLQDDPSAEIGHGFPHLGKDGLRLSTGIDVSVVIERDPTLDCRDDGLHGGLFFVGVKRAVVPVTPNAHAAVGQARDLHAGLGNGIRLHSRLLFFSVRFRSISAIGRCILFIAKARS